MNQASMVFVETCGPFIARRNLCRNFLLHLVSMHDFNLVSLATIDRAMARLRGIQEELGPDVEPLAPLEHTLAPAASCNGTGASGGGSKQGKRTKSGMAD